MTSWPKARNLSTLDRAHAEQVRDAPTLGRICIRIHTYIYVHVRTYMYIYAVSPGAGKGPACVEGKLLITRSLTWDTPSGSGTAVDSDSNRRYFVVQIYRLRCRKVWGCCTLHPRQPLMNREFWILDRGHAERVRDDSRLRLLPRVRRCPLTSLFLSINLEPRVE